MNATAQTVDNGSDDTRRIDYDRYTRAIKQDMDVTELGPSAYEVRHDGETYAVDLEAAHCTCPDHEYRDARCKHMTRAALFAAFTEGVRTQFTAAVVRAASEHGCADGYHACGGPTGDTLPCQTCIHGTSTGEWTVWSVLVDGRPATEVREPDASTDAGSQEPELVADGGQETDPDSPHVLRRFDADYNVISETEYDTLAAAYRVRDAMMHDQRVRSCIVPADDDAGSQDLELVADGGQETAPAPGDAIGDLDAANAAAQAGLLLRVQPEAPDPTEYIAIRAGSWAVRKHGQRMWFDLSADEARERVTAALALTERAGGGGVRAADHDDGLAEAERQ